MRKGIANKLQKSACISAPPYPFFSPFSFPRISSSRFPLSYVWQAPTQKDLTLPLVAPYRLSDPQERATRWNASAVTGGAWGRCTGTRGEGLSLSLLKSALPALTSKRVHVSVALRS